MMSKERYEKPIIEIIDLKDDIIVTSDGCYRDSGCFTDGQMCSAFLDDNGSCIGNFTC